MFEILIIIKFICRLAKEEEMQESRKRVDELEKENLELATQLGILFNFMKKNLNFQFHDFFLLFLNFQFHDFFS